MHPCRHHRPPGEIDCVDETVGAVDGPALRHGGVEQCGGVIQQPGRRLLQGLMKLTEEPRPFHPVTHRGPERPERVRRKIPVVLEQGLPLLVVVFGQSPFVGPGVAVDQPLGDAQSSCPPDRLTGHIGGDQERLDQVHVGVRPAVGLELRPLLVEDIDRKSVLLAPEPGLRDGHGLCQQLGRTGSADGRRGGRGEQHERRFVGALIAFVAWRGNRRVPAAEGGVGDLIGERRQPVVDQLGRTRVTPELGQREDVGHPRGDPGLHRMPGVNRTRVVEPAETACRATGTGREVEQPSLLGEQPWRSRCRGIAAGASMVPRS